MTRMLVIVSVTFVAMKLVTLAVARVRLAPAQLLAFLAWGGMRPALFTALGNAPRPGARALALRGARNAAAGVALFVVARAVAPHSEVAAIGLAMIALSLIVHFGLFDLLAAFWRTRGVAADALFRAPLAARSLAEFWSRRWNIGYSEMIATVVHRPIRSRFGPHAALAASFLASGILHELAITVPVGAAYGLPTLYFLLHGLAVAVEKRLPAEPGRLWVFLWLVLPLPLCFPPVFLRKVIAPLL
ncbi:MAG TPA: MBOAT family protein [Thermoanaerobaculia bacterium]|nr:MBOAT family protein [Thermoanaerobaculia bacterium]